MLGLARVRRVAPKIRFDPTKRRCDAETLRAVITHRYKVLATFARCLKQTALEEIRALQARATLGLRESRALQAVQHGLQRDAENLPEPERVALERALQASTVLCTLYSMRQELTALWSRSTASKEQLVNQLEVWCQRAEESDILALQEFSRKLRCYD
jgi:stearoyl-CoA desaturase (delta-9 desaturase)